MNAYQPFAVNTAPPAMQYIEVKKKKTPNQKGAGCKLKKADGPGKTKDRVKSINTNKDKEEHNYIFRNSKYVKKDE